MPTADHPALQYTDDAEFLLDLRVVESSAALLPMACDTSDGCGSTCTGSACSSASNDPL